MDQTMSGECRIKSFETQPTGYNREMPRIIHKMVKHIKNHAANVALARIFLMFDHFMETRHYKVNSFITEVPII